MGKGAGSGAAPRYTYPTWVAALFVGAVVSLSLPLFSFFGPETRVLGVGLATIHNVILLACTLPILVYVGLRSWFNPVVLAAGWLLLAGFTLSSRWPALTGVQSFKTFAALVLAAYIFELKLDARTVRWLCRLLPWSAVINLAVAVASYVIVGRPFHAVLLGAWRLSGTTIPGHLAYLGVVGLLFSLLGALRRPHWIWLVIVNYGVVVWTGSRTAMLGGVLLILGFLVARTKSRPAGASFWTREIVALVACVPLWLLSYAPWWSERMDQLQHTDERITIGWPDGVRRSSARADGADSRASGLTVTLAMTGRLKAWDHYWQVARENPWFGRGLGAGVVAGEGTPLHPSFHVPHSEYLRFLVDGGIVGLLAVLAGYGTVFIRLLRTATPSFKVMLATAAVVLALDAALRNPLIAQHFIVPFWLFLGIAGGALPASDRAPGSTRDSAPGEPAGG